MVTYESIYGGNYYALDRNDGFKGYRSGVGNLSLAIDPRTANQLQETSNKLNIGVKNIEVQGTFPNILEAIPDEHLKEIRRISKLTGAKLSLHGPMIEPSGFNQQGGWSEPNRQHIERQLTNAIERSHELDPDGNIVVTLHSSAQLPELLQREKIGGKEKTTQMYVVDPRTGKVAPLKETERFFEENIQGKKYEFNPEKELEKVNKETWDNQLHNFAYSSYRASEIIESPLSPEETIHKEIKAGRLTEEEAKEKLKEFVGENGRENLERREEIAKVFLKNSYDQLKELYDSAYKSALDSGRSKDIEKLDKFAAELKKDYNKLEKYDIDTMNKVIQDGIKVLNNIESPKIWTPFNDFVIDKSSDTFANVAFKAYDKFKSSAPVISIENPPAGQGLSRAEDIKKLIDESRDKLANSLHKEKGIDKNEAQKIAEKMIGATWDVGHINMIRKYGYEKADLIKQAEIIKPYLKHVHLSDNFGYEHTELPMGMGNVPLKEELEKFGDKVKNVQKVIETGDWWQHFKTPPIIDTFGNFGTPVYSTGVSPYWNQISSRYGNYFAGQGTTLPEQHFSLYGGGFSGLPTELGGQVQTRGSRATGGTPMA